SCAAPWIWTVPVYGAIHRRIVSSSGYEAVRCWLCWDRSPIRPVLSRVPAVMGTGGSLGTPATGGTPDPHRPDRTTGTETGSAIPSPLTSLKYCSFEETVST